MLHIVPKGRGNRPGLLVRKSDPDIVDYTIVDSLRVLTLALTAAIIFVVIVPIVIVVVDIVFVDRNASVCAATNSGANGRNVATGPNRRDRCNLWNENEVAPGVGRNRV